MRRIGAARLGFGTAFFPSRLTHQECTSLLDAVLDSGIHHIDTARMYGHGRAEYILGEIVRRRRKDIILVSKAGIAPPSTSVRSRILRRVIAELSERSIEVAVPRTVRSRLGPQFGKFKPSEIVASLELSLKALQTDHLDALLLHECAVTDITDSVLLLMDRLKAEGKILSFGIATSAEESVAILDAYPNQIPIVQVPYSVWQPTLKSISSRSDIVRITHSVLGDRFNALTARILVEPHFRELFSAFVGVDAGDQSALAQLFLEEALLANPNGTVLFSSRRHEHIARNARLAAAASFDLGRLARLREFILCETASA